jgi:hypothetical protein
MYVCYADGGVTTQGGSFNVPAAKSKLARTHLARVSAKR